MTTPEPTGESLSVGYATWVPIAFGVLGVLNLLLGIGTESVLSMVLGGLFVLLGVLMFRGKLTVVHPHEVEIKNLLGMTLRRRQINGFGDLSLDGNKLMQRSTGDKILSLAFMAHPGDVAALRNAIGSAPEAPPAN